MTDFLEKFFYMARVGLSQLETNAKVKNECIQLMKLQLHGLL